MTTFKIAIGYPPLEQAKGTPLLSQNRQFQYFHQPTYIYPMVPAYAASLLKTAGYKVAWLDGIAEKQTYVEWAAQLEKAKPDLLLMETKSPVIKKHWQIVSELKKTLPNMIVVFAGDQVTCEPKETLEASLVDYILTGGDYDFLLVNLVNHLTKNEDLQGGVWGRKPEGGYFLSGPLKYEHNLDQLPFIDRELTKWQLYAYENGNYKYTPATYMYSGRDCWWNRCTFCVWDQTLNPRGSYRHFSPERLFAEVKKVVDELGVKEIFDDAGTMFVGSALTEFCKLMISSGYNQKVVYGCNMRLNALKQADYDLMKKAGFRFILYGMESANQFTLDKIDKGLKVAEIEEGLRMAKKAGLDPHITIMLGYPWETEEMALNTIRMAKDLFNKGYVDTMQATIVIPYPGTPLYKECLEKDWFQVDPKDYEAFDMRGPVMKAPFSNARLMEMTQMLYASFFSPKFIWRKVTAIRSWGDIKFLFMAARKLLAHLLDFGSSNILKAFNRLFTTKP